MSDASVPARRPAWLMPVVVGVTSLALRFWTLDQQRAGNPLFRTAILDDQRYLDIVTGNAPSQAWFHGPLYSWVLSLVGAAELASACAVNAFVGVVTSVAIALVARQLHSDRAGWIAGLIHAAAGVFVFHDIIPGPAALLGLLHVVALGLAVAWCRSGSWWLGGLVGVVTGVAMMGRPTAAALGPAALFVAWRAIPSRKRFLVGSAAAAAGLLLVLFPAALRNQSVIGEFTPLPWNGGVNAYAANGPEARRSLSIQASEFGYTPDEMEANSRRIAEKAEGRSLRPSEVSDYWLRRTWDERGTPAEMAAHLGKKALLLFWVDEYGGNHSVQVERRFSTWLGFAPVGGWWMLALGAGGWWLVRRRVPEADFVAVAALITWVEFTLIFPVGRYRLPVVVLALVTAAAGIAEALRRDAARARLGAAIACTLAVGSAAFVPTWAGFLEHPHASNYGNLATAAAKAGRLRLALEVLEEGLERGEDDMRNLGLHAQFLTEAGRDEDAAAARKRLEQAAEGTPVQDVRRVFFLARDGKADEAEALGNRLLGEPLAAPLRAELHANLAFTAFRSGDIALARERLAEARDIAPAHPHVARVAQIIGD